MNCIEQPALVATYNMHGNEPLGARVAGLLEGNNHIATVDLHPVAAAKGVRFLSSAGELGSRIPYYGGGDNANPDNQAAARATKILEGYPASTRVVDVHCTTLPNQDFACLGNLVPVESLAMARLLGRTIIQQFPAYPFFENFFNVIGIESSVCDDKEMEEQARRLATGLHLVAELGNTGLRRYFYDTGMEDLQFYKRFVNIMLVHPNGEPNQAVLDVLDELEEIVVSGIYSPVTISPRVAAALQIRPGRYPVNTWGYDNMSLLMEDGIRRKCFGDLLYEVAPPARIGKSDLLYFGYKPDA